jgi:LPS export ABC transporter protein LptC
LRTRRAKIKFISILFAVAAVGIFVMLSAFLIGTKKDMFEGNAFRHGKNSFSNVSFKTFDSSGKNISLKSDEVYESQKDHYVFKNLVSAFALSNGELVTVSANQTKAIRKDRTECEFIGNVKLSTESGLLMESEKLFVDCNKKIASGDSDVVISQENTHLSAKGYFFDMNNNTLTLNNKANGSFKSNKISANKMIICFNDMHKKSVKSIDAFENANFTTPDYTLKASKSILYTENEVKASQNVVLFYHKDSSSYDVRADSMQAKINNGALGTVKANGSLIIKTKDAKIRSDSGILDGDNVNVFGNVVISGKHGNIFGKTATIDTKTGKVLVSKSSGIVDDGKHR